MDMNYMQQDPRVTREMISLLERQLVEVRTAAEANPNDYNVYAKWGELLLELSMFKNGDEATQILSQCINKLEKSLSIFPDNPHPMIVLASALNARAFLQHDSQVALSLFERSKKNFQRALELDPTNEKCRQLLEAMENAPELHQRVVAQLQAEGQYSSKAASNSGNDEWFYDALGWGILIFGGISVLAILNMKQAAA
eukprot:768351-Hanusia_phi.AAC.5